VFFHKTQERWDFAPEPLTPCPYRNTSLEEEGTQLIDEACAPLHQSIADPVNCLEVELIVRLDGDEPHGWPLHGFGYRLRIHVIILLRFDERPYELCRDKPDPVSVISAVRARGSVPCNWLPSQRGTLEHSRDTRAAVVATRACEQ
jgi:hypothetical protein